MVGLLSASDVFEAACSGWQPADLTAQRPRRRSDMPLGRYYQHQTIGIE